MKEINLQQMGTLSLGLSVCSRSVFDDNQSEVNRSLESITSFALANLYLSVCCFRFLFHNNFSEFSGL